jgi:FlaA1/EpsC-like NDP-sugar epimerase
MQTELEVLSLLGRDRALFVRDLTAHQAELAEGIRGTSFLVLGGAGSIGQQVVKAIFPYQPARLHVVDVSENNLVELVRDLRSSHGYIEGDFRTFPLNCGEPEFDAFWRSTPPYDAVLNLTALKHVRSERDPFTLMRMLHTNVLTTDKTLRQAIERGVSRYFAVSSDKAVNPANAMGASKRAMELCLMRASDRIDVSSTRFANVAFSDGSLLQGFVRRLAKRQPLAAPRDVRRYFITAEEAGRLCLLAAILGRNRDSFIPVAGEGFAAIDFITLADRFLRQQGYEPHPCATEEEARHSVEALAAEGKWPCFFAAGDTAGEKPVEEFAISGETRDTGRFEEVDVICWQGLEDEVALERFLAAMRQLRDRGRWSRDRLLDELKALVPEFQHRETGRFLDARM